MRIRPVLSNLTDTRPRNHIRERDRNESPHYGSRSRVEGNKRAERSEIERGPCHCQKQLDGGDHGSGVEVSGSAVSVPRGESPTTGQRIAAPILAAPISKVLSGGT